MSLSEYKKKRDFKNSPEPTGNESSAKKVKGNNSLKNPIFVVQKHNASHLHYDFRLEHDGVLLSWAIPKEPSMDPEIKRLAIKVEDHPLDYARFEGDIPEGEYGAGHIEIWDSGTYKLYNKTIPQGLKKGHVHVVLDGGKLKGEFSLIRFETENKNSWLFFKNIEEMDAMQSSDDNKVEQLVEEYKPRKGKPARIVKPMLTKLVKEPFSDKDWLFELKYDGYRIIAHVGKKVRLQSRNGKDYTDKFPQLVKELSKYDKKFVLDGEVIVQNEKGVSDFELLQKYLKDGSGEPAFVFFDILQFEEFDLRQQPLNVRKQFLNAVLVESEHIIEAKYIRQNGKELFELAKEQKLEGIIAKNLESEYEADKRSGSWQKVKNDSFANVFIAGFTAPKKGRKHFGSLLMAVKKGKGFVYVGRLGTGYNEEQQAQIRALLKPLIVSRSKISTPKLKEQVVWTSPKVEIEVSFIDRTSEGMLRHASFQGLKDSDENYEIESGDYSFGYGGGHSRVRTWRV